MCRGGLADSRVVCLPGALPDFSLSPDQSVGWGGPTADDGAPLFSILHSSRTGCMGWVGSPVLFAPSLARGGANRWLYRALRRVLVSL